MRQERSAIVTLPREYSADAWGTPLRYVGDGRLNAALTDAARSFIDVKRKEGEWYYSADDIHVYGPFPSKQLIDAMLTNEDFTISKYDQTVLARDFDNSMPWVHYLLHATFTVGRDAPVLERTTDDAD